jgi:hypothetical protein
MLAFDDDYEDHACFGERRKIHLDVSRILYPAHGEDDGGLCTAIWTRSIACQRIMGC